MTDALTGLRNRRTFEERLALEFSVAKRRERALSVLLIDVDFFKQINDRWGHAAGDTGLRSLESILRATVRLPELVARYGGEEFAVLLPEGGTEAAPWFGGSPDGSGRGRDMGARTSDISLGIAILTAENATGFELVEQADQALYEAKRGGRNRAVVFDVNR